MTACTESIESETRGADSVFPAWCDAFHKAHRLADQGGEARFVALQRRVPLRDPLVDYAKSTATNRFYWTQPSGERSMACLGDVEVHVVAADGRFERASVGGRALLDRVELVGASTSLLAGPLLYGGFAFDASSQTDPRWQGFPAGRLILAERQIVRLGTQCFETRVARVAPNTEPPSEEALQAAFVAWSLELDPDVVEERKEGSSSLDLTDLNDNGEGPRFTVGADRSHARFCGLVASALDYIGQGDMEKLVVARALDVEHPGHFDITRFLGQLRTAYPDCATFGLSQGNRHFVAASPERLVGLEGERVRTCALAGSAPRGRSPERDEELGRELLNSKKNQIEHEAVVRAVRSDLAAICKDVRGPEAPRLLKLDGIQHLETPLEATYERRGEARLDIIDLVARLHPTPAVSGLPKRESKAWIREHEDLDRGWYAAPVGFVTADGGGEFWVALRSAVIDNGGSGASPLATARLFAGAGIVPGSVPELELGETRIKLRALLAPLTEI